MRGKKYDGSVYVTQLQDLRKGDEVFVSMGGDRYVKVKVKRVRKVECSIIITVDKFENYCTRYVGYYTNSVATGERRCVLTLDTYWGDMIEKVLADAEKRSETVVKRIDALRGLKVIKDWLFHKEDWRDKELE